MPIVLLLTDIANLYLELYDTNIHQNNKDLKDINSLTDCSILNEILTFINPGGFNLEISKNMCEFVGSKFIKDIQYQFLDIPLNEKEDFIAFITHQDLNILAINKKDLKIYCSIDGEEFVVLADTITHILYLIKNILEFQKKNGIQSDTKMETERFLKLNDGYYNIDYFIDYLFG